MNVKSINILMNSVNGFQTQNKQHNLPCLEIENSEKPETNNPIEEYKEQLKKEL